MQYFVGYLVEGSASEYYNSITSDLEQKFGIKNLASVTPPHFTFRIPFETERIDDFEKYVDNIIKDISCVDIQISKFEKLEGKRMTIFLSAYSQHMTVFENVVDILESYDQGQKTPSRPLVLHTTIGRHLSYEQSDEVWNYLQTVPKPNFFLSFNNLTIFKLTDGDIWTVHKIFRF